MDGQQQGYTGMRPPLAPGGPPFAAAQRQHDPSNPAYDDPNQKLKRQRSGNGLKPGNSDAPVTMQAMKAHLDTHFFIGYRPGDPTAGPPPTRLPPPKHPVPPEAQIINLTDWSHERLMAEAASTMGIDPSSVLLKDSPGVPPERIAYITGQAPKKKDLPSNKQQQFAKAAPLAPPAGLQPEVKIEQQQQQQQQPKKEEEQDDDVSVIVIDD